MQLHVKTVVQFFFKQIILTGGVV